MLALKDRVGEGGRKEELIDQGHMESSLAARKESHSRQHVDRKRRLDGGEKKQSSPHFIY